MEGDYIKATPIEGTVVVNIADFMQRWTADKLVSTVSIKGAFRDSSMIYLWHQLACFY